MRTSRPRRAKCSASFFIGGASCPGLDGLRRSSTWSVTSMCFADGGTADAVPLPVDHVGQARGEDPAVLQLRDPAAAEGHRLRNVEQAGEVGVRVRLVLLYIEAVGPAEQLPVHA